MDMAQQETQVFKQLKELLREMFQLDRGDLDFGLYRIMNQKRGEVTEFLDKHLLPQVRTVLEEYQTSGGSTALTELNKLVANLNEAGVDPETSPKVQELRAKLTESVDMDKLENEIYSDLYNFFKRYYSDGDFMSMRRYKEGVYALPYEGEEVKLHWANHDQYYTKTSENLKNYSFKISSDKRVRFEVVAGGTETNNNKAAEGKERRFVLHEAAPTVAIEGELTIRFEYRPDDGKRKQGDINKETLEQLFNLAEATSFSLNKKAPTEKNPERTLLEKHLSNYTTKHNFDYFIHKNLGRFLRRELDFYIKNEIMHLDDIENETAPKVESYLAKVKAMRKVAGKIIQFLAQMEDFQKKIWLKKKFVLETHYCITLDYIIGSDVEGTLLPIIASNDQQREDWVKLFAIDDLNGYAKPLTVDFLKANDKLLVDTKFFDADFKYTLLSIFEDLDEQTDGLLINSDNFQALGLLSSRYKKKIDTICIDPPYNTGGSEFVYKNSYQHSSWISMIDDRIRLSKQLMHEKSIFSSAIDDFELSNLSCVLASAFQPSNFLGNLVVEIKPSGRTNDYFLSTSHEYVCFYGLEKENCNINFFDLTDNEAAAYKYDDGESQYKWRDFLRTGGNSTPAQRPNSYYPIYYNNQTKEISLSSHEGSVEIFPLDSTGAARVWRKTPPSLQEHLNAGDIQIVQNRDGKYKVQIKDRIKAGTRPKSVWVGSKYDASSHGTKLLGQMFAEYSFSFPKSINAVQDTLHISSNEESTVIDFFAGSGTTGHAVINLNRENDGERKYILVEMGEYFASVTHPRILKAAYSKDWKDGKPVSRDGVSQIIKYMALEQYEDALDNLGLSKSETQSALLASNPTLNEQYMLGYMMDVESRGSQSLLNIDAFADPFAYTLRITRNDDTQLVNVDLIETFNYLLGLTIRTVDRDKTGIVTVAGKNALSANCLIIWRNTNNVTNDALDAWFDKRYSSKDFEFDAIYVNGDNNIENMKLADDHWKVRLIEAEFKRLMFDVQDV